MTSNSSQVGSKTHLGCQAFREVQGDQWALAHPDSPPFRTVQLDPGWEQKVNGPFEGLQSRAEDKALNIMKKGPGCDDSL
jgi:hypothetical protein